MKKAYLIGNNSNTSNIITHENKESIRLNKYISSSGYCSRRVADTLIEEGKVKIDGTIAIMGSKVFNNQIVQVNDYIIQPKEELIYIALNKPIGITCTTDLKDKDNIIDYININDRIFPIGRLDKDSNGLILLTNDGDIVNKLLRSQYGHEKEYIVKVDKIITNDFINKMCNGVKIFNMVSGKHQLTKPCKVNKINNYEYSIILTEGLNRQIRRMSKELGYTVVKLQRVRFMNVKLVDMPIGSYRYLSEEELIEMNNLINRT